MVCRREFQGHHCTVNWGETDPTDEQEADRGISDKNTIDSEREEESPASDLRKMLTFSGRFGFEEGLAGIEKRTLENFSVSAEDMEAAVLLAYSQMGLADIFHILMAKHYSCDSIGTIDSDYQRLREPIRNHFGIEVLYKEDVFQALRRDT